MTAHKLRSHNRERDREKMNTIIKGLFRRRNHLVYNFIFFSIPQFDVSAIDAYKYMPYESIEAIHIQYDKFGD